MQGEGGAPCKLLLILGGPSVGGPMQGEGRAPCKLLWIGRALCGRAHAQGGAGPVQAVVAIFQIKASAAVRLSD